MSPASGGAAFVLLFGLFALALVGDVAASVALLALGRRPEGRTGRVARGLVRWKRACRVGAPVLLLLAGALWVVLSSGVEHAP